MFDSKSFNKTAWEPRTEEVEVEELKSFFGKDEKPIFKIKGLNGEELYYVKSSSERDKAITAALTAMCSSGSEQVKAFKELMAVDVPEEYGKRIEILMLGLVEPKLERETIVRIFKSFPAVVTLLTDKIMQLTGLGHELGKQKGSGKTSASETH